MKKLQLLFALLFAAVISNAQTEAGNILIAGSSQIDFTSLTVTPEYAGEEGTEVTQQSFNFAPAVGYFVIDKLAVGLELSYDTSKLKYDDDWSDPTTSTSIAAFGRYYFLSEGFTPFLQAHAGFGANSNGEDDSDKSSGLIFGGTIGASYFFGEHVGIDMGIGYAKRIMTNNADEDYKAKTSSLGLQIGIVVSL